MVIIKALEHQADKVTLTIITEDIMTLITMVTKITTITVIGSVSFKLHVSTCISLWPNTFPFINCTFSAG
jgi:hypothetical protein